MLFKDSRVFLRERAPWSNPGWMMPLFGPMPVFDPEFLTCVFDSRKHQTRACCKDLRFHVIYQRCVCVTSGWLTSQVLLPFMGKHFGMGHESLSWLNEFSTGQLPMIIYNCGGLKSEWVWQITFYKKSNKSVNLITHLVSCPRLAWGGCYQPSGLCEWSSCCEGRSALPASDGTPP